MQNNIIWEGLNDESVENCNVQTNESGYTADSTVSLCLNDGICNIEYHISINNKWESQHCKITTCEDEGATTIELNRLPGNYWLLNGKPEDKFTGCTGIDISITPFTNSFIINRKELREEESIEMQIIYIDAIKMQCEPITVRYTQLSENEFEYENLTTGYNVVLDVDDSGLVVNYPGFFRMLQ